MDPLNATFVDYQARYETVLPIKVREGLNLVQERVHHVVTVMNEAVQIPEQALRIIQLSVATLSLSAVIDPFLGKAKQFCKDAKNLTNVVKGLKSIDGFLNFKFLWKSIVLNVSGLTLFIVSSLSLIDRFKPEELRVLKVQLASVPIFGILPYGGMLSFSIVGLLGVTALLALDKKGELEKKEKNIEQKLLFWSKPFNLHKVKKLQVKYTSSITKIKKEIIAYEALIEEGKEVKRELRKANETRRLFACKKALNELATTLVKKRKDLSGKTQKLTEYTLVRKKWKRIDGEELESFRQAKEAKWEKKFNKLEKEKKANFLSLVNCVVTVARQILVLSSVGLGYGVVNLPHLVNIGLDVTVAGCGIASVAMKKSVQNMNISSVELGLSSIR